MKPVATGTQFLLEMMSPYASLPPDDFNRLRLEIRPLGTNLPHGKDCRKVRKWFPIDNEGIVKAYEYCNSVSEEWDVYYGILPRNGERGESDDVNYTGWLWCDLDAGEADLKEVFAFAKTLKLPQKPHISVVSGYGIHLYWRLADVVSIHDDKDKFSFKQTLQRIALMVNGAMTPDTDVPHACRSVCDPVRILRVPDTFNYKRGDCKDVKVIRFDPYAEAHSLKWWRLNLPALPVEPKIEHGDYNPMNCRIPRRVKEILETSTGEGRRHDTCESLMSSAWRAGMSVDDMIDIGRQFCAVNRWSVSEMERIVGWMSRQGRF